MKRGPRSALMLVERIMYTPSPQREFGIYGKYMNRGVRGGNEENNSLEVFGENSPQGRIEWPTRGSTHGSSSLSWLWELLV